MRKLIVFSVVLALLSVAAFAQPSVGGSLGAKVTIIQGNSEDSEALTGGINFANRHVNVTYSNSDGTAGGLVRLYAAGATGWWGATPFAFGWWKPIPQLRLQIGHNPDGDFGAAQITGWGFNAEAQDFVAIDSDSGDSSGNGWKTARRAGFYGGFSDNGVTLSVFPMDGLTINLVFPFAGGHSESGNGKPVGEIYSRVHLNVVFALPDVGALRVSFQGLGGLDEDMEKSAPAGNFFASFYLTAIEGLGIDLGAGFGVPYKDAADLNNNPYGVQLGLGLRYVAGDFGIKARFGTQLIRESAGSKSPTTIGLVFLPYYGFGNGLTGYLNAGFGITIPEGDADQVVDWLINPYIRKAVSAFTFYAGFKLWSDGGPDPVTKWAIPIGFNAYF